MHKLLHALQYLVRAVFKQLELRSGHLQPAGQALSVVGHASPEPACKVSLHVVDSQLCLVHPEGAQMQRAEMKPR